MEGRLPCNAFYKYRGNKYPVHINRRGQWWRLDGLYIPSSVQMTLTSSVAEVDEGMSKYVHIWEDLRERRHAEELRRLAGWARIRGGV